MYQHKQSYILVSFSYPRPNEMKPSPSKNVEFPLSFRSSFSLFYYVSSSCVSSSFLPELLLPAHSHLLPLFVPFLSPSEPSNLLHPHLEKPKAKK
jgi:hypothetical protein